MLDDLIQTEFERTYDMKNLLATTALIVATATAATAQDASQLREQVSNELATYSMNVDVSMLSDEEVTELYTVLTSTDDQGAAQQRVRGILAGSGAVSMDDPEAFVVSMGMEMDQFDEAVSLALAENGYEDVDVSTLTTSQKAEIFTLASSDEMETDINERLGAIVGM